jgi:hypothetical protein
MTGGKIPIVSEIREGTVIGGWEIVRTGLRRNDHPLVRLRCTECGAHRTSRASTVRTGGVYPCRHSQQDGRRGSRPARPPLERPGPARVYAWVTAKAPDRTFTAAEAAAGLGVTRAAIGNHLTALVRSGDLAMPRFAVYGLPGVTAEPLDQADRDKITVFLAADGGGAFPEIRAATGYSSSRLGYLLARMAQDGKVVRLDDGPGGFWLLPGQEPGQILDVPG